MGEKPRGIITSWNYRIVKRDSGKYELCGVYYKEDGAPYYFISAINIRSKNIGELQTTMKQMNMAFKRDILNESDFVVQKGQYV